MGVDNGSSTVTVRSLRTGRLRSRHAGVTEAPGPESVSSVTGIALKANGSVAWIGQANSIIGPAFIREVERSDSTGFAVLDKGDGIGLHSLALHGSTLSWSDDGKTHSAIIR